ncbi:MAG: NAD(P)/FAD-dependent oxidoreductase [Ignavibacteriales bacterium]|nr:NAD(P)/FAD-dependent oxidoreductase [Ignavibacteriales bacterium]
MIRFFTDIFVDSIMEQKTIIIIGGGMGGIVTARDLRKHIGSQHKIIVIDRHSYHAFQPSFLWIVIGWRTPAAITKPFTSLEKHGIEFQQAEVISIDKNDKIVVTDRGNFHFDYLVIALGADNELPAEFAVGNRVNTFYTFEGAVELSKIIPIFPGGKIEISQLSNEVKYPFAPFDAAFLLSSFYQKRGIGNIEIILNSPNQEPLPFAPSEINIQMRKLLVDQHINFLPNTQLDKNPDDPISRITLQTKSSEPDISIIVPPMKPPDALRLSNMLDASGWIKVNKRTMQTDFNNIYAIGDCINIKMENGHILPKAGIFANNQAEVVAFNIAQELQENSDRKEFSGYGFFFLETGNGKASYLHGNLINTEKSVLSWTDPNVTLHWSKVVLEKYWLWRWL